MIQYIVPVFTINFLQYLYFSRRIDIDHNKIHTKLDTIEYKVKMLEERLSRLYK
jgi:hypothetical protein